MKHVSTYGATISILVLGVALWSSADPLTIPSMETYTIPAGTTTNVAGVVADSGSAANYTTLIINGTLNITADINLGSYAEIQMGPGSVLDLNGHDVITSGSTKYTFMGETLNRITLQSTGSPGSFLDGAFPVIAEWSYVDVIGLGDSAFGRSHNTASGFVRYEYCTFTGCAKVALENTGVGANCGFLVSHCDFRNPAAADPEAAADMQPTLYQPNAIGSQQRRMECCTWSQSGAINGVLELRASGMTVADNVFKNYKLYCQYETTHYERNFFFNDLAELAEFFKPGWSTFETMTDNYFHYTAGWHPLGSSPVGITVTGNVFDAIDGGVGNNWFLWGVCNGEVTIQRNIFLGKGIPLTFTKAGEPTIDFSRNTILIDNAGEIGSGLSFSSILLTEQIGELTGSVEIYNNLIVDPDSTTETDIAVELLTGTPDQITYLDYNVGWTEPGGAPTPPVQYDTNVIVTAGVGIHDTAIDPQFADPQRTLKTWDTALGGPGTTTNAINALVSRSTGYTPQALVAYMKEGFTPTVNSLSEMGRNGDNIGAMDFDDPSDEPSKGTVERNRDCAFLNDPHEVNNLENDH